MPRLARTALTLALALTCPGPAAAQLAFDGALGFGAVATGGRGGRVIHVTTLAASGPGSLAAAAAASGPRYVVFDVSGVIEGDVEIASGDVTIAGQTAPGAGITIHGHLFTPYDEGVANIVVRHVRVRPPPPAGDWAPEQHDAIQMSDAHRVLFDHVDVSHGVDELVDHWLNGQDITWQSSLFSFPNPDGGHPDGAHPYCILTFDGDAGSGGGRISILGNLFAQCRTRTPAIGVGPSETVNNVVYGGREGFVHHNTARGVFVIAGNTYVDGPSYELAPFWFDADNDPAPTDYYMGDNRVIDPGVFDGLVESPWTTPGFSDAYTFEPGHIGMDQFHPLSEAPSFVGAGYGAYARQPVDEAYEEVLDCAGAWPRDHVSSTAVSETRSRTGMVRNLATGDLMVGLTPGTPPSDGDDDGMPDAWESMHGLDPASDDHDRDLGGWPAIEVYLDELADSLTPCGGSSPGIDAGMLPDAGAIDAAGTDAGAIADIDAPGARMDAGGSTTASGGCGCRAGHAPAGGAGVVGLVLALLARRRRG